MRTEANNDYWMEKKRWIRESALKVELNLNWEKQRKEIKMIPAFQIWENETVLILL